MIPRSQIRVSALALLFLAISRSVVRADGLDPTYFIRFDVTNHSWTYICTVLAIIMFANYLLNVAVIGLPAILRASVPRKRVAVGLIILTILGQVADRLGSIVGLFVAIPLAALVSVLLPSAERGMGGPVFTYSLFAANLICSGIAVGEPGTVFSAQAVVGCEVIQLEDRDCSGGLDQPCLDTLYQADVVMTVWCPTLGTATPYFD